MAILKLRNYDDSFFQFNLPVAVISDRAFNSLTAGNFTDSNNIQWKITRSTGNNIVTVAIQTLNRVPGLSITQIMEMLDEKGLGDLLIPENNLINKLESGNNYRLGLADAQSETLYPYIRIQRADSTPNPSNHTVTLTNNFQYTANYGFTSSGGTNILDSPNAGSSIFAISTGGANATYIYGSCITQFMNYGSTGIFGTITLQVNLTALTSENWAEIEYEPGEKGFKPTSDRTTNRRPGIGGRGKQDKPTPQYKSDPIEQPGEPDETKASAAGSGFITAYDITTANLQGVGACLWGTTLQGFLSGLLVNPLDFIVSLAVFPYIPHIGGSTPIKLGRWLCKSDLSDPNALGVSANGSPLTSQFRTIDFGTVAIDEEWGSFLDYEHTSIQLYLPFIGTVDIDVAECMNGTINVQYTIDFFTGQCVANVLCTKPLMLPSGKSLSNVHAQHSFQGNCATQIPISRADYGAMIGNLINACTQSIANPVTGAVNIAEGAVSGAFRPNITTKGNIVANSGFCAVLYPYVRITRPITAEPDSYQEVSGYPSYINTVLGECNGLCVCEDIEIKNANGATESEINRIIQLCREGVFV